MMRVIAGSARSMPLKAPEGKETRPTTDRIKETLFNMIQNEIPGCVFMDLYAGSGGIGIEALSRGAEKCYFIENNKSAVQCIRYNLNFTKLSDAAVIHERDVLTAMEYIKEKRVDLIFMDPPYGSDYVTKVLVYLKNASFVTQDTLLIAETALDFDLAQLAESEFTLVKQKKYKTNQHIFLKKE